LLVIFRKIKKEPQTGRFLSES